MRAGVGLARVVVAVVVGSGQRVGERVDVVGKRRHVGPDQVDLAGQRGDLAGRGPYLARHQDQPVGDDGGAE
jgi:hypothetical protein